MSRSLLPQPSGAAAVAVTTSRRKATNALLGSGRRQAAGPLHPRRQQQGPRPGTRQVLDADRLRPDDRQGRHRRGRRRDRPGDVPPDRISREQHHTERRHPGRTAPEPIDEQAEEPLIDRVRPIVTRPSPAAPSRTVPATQARLPRGSGPTLPLAVIPSSSSRTATPSSSGTRKYGPKIDRSLQHEVERDAERVRPHTGGEPEQTEQDPREQRPRPRAEPFFAAYSGPLRIAGTSDRATRPPAAAEPEKAPHQRRVVGPADQRRERDGIAEEEASIR